MSGADSGINYRGAPRGVGGPPRSLASHGQRRMGVGGCEEATAAM